MQKIIVSLAIICGLMVATTQLKAANRYRIQPVVTVCMQDSGFVLTKLEALNEKVQTSIKSLEKDYTLDALMYHAEKQITKMEATKKEDQSKVIFYFDAEGKIIDIQARVTEEKEETKKEEPPVG